MNICTAAVGGLSTNCYILFRAERGDAVVIDPGADGERILDVLSGRTVAAVLLTHGHYDHTGALHVFKGMPVYIHPADSAMLNDPDLSVGAQVRDIAVRPAATDYVTEGSLFSAAGIDFSVLHTPGHTPGSVCYRTGSDLFTGDTLFRHGYGRTDFPGGDFSELMKSLRCLLKLPGEIRIYPGHGESSTLAKERGNA